MTQVPLVDMQRGPRPWRVILHFEDDGRYSGSGIPPGQATVYLMADARPLASASQRFNADIDPTFLAGTIKAMAERINKRQQFATDLTDQLGEDWSVTLERDAM